ncbi:LPS translocon maturation chaperone LptM [Kushneria konosiri]|uniref:Lipoprotein n=1 Tax=Kushneria konosiri TaxID=698828 RepID=A0A2Z2HB99_9GAMM|nr:hypothetical protein B9G99_07510 [Kushneria konosiri]
MNRLILAMMTALVLAGCGQTGPLYMPDNQQARDRYDPQGDHQSGDVQADSAKQDNAQQGDDTERQSAVSVPDGDSSPETTTAGKVGGAATTVAPAAPAAAGQGGT